jgi:hypothetical protein
MQLRFVSKSAIVNCQLPHQKLPAVSLGIPNNGMKHKAKWKRSSNDFANITVATSPQEIAAYFEFSTRFSNELTVETNTNRALPLTPDNPETRVFLFPKIKELDALYKLHLQLIEKHAAGQRAQGEPKGQELERLVSVIANYGRGTPGPASWFWERTDRRFGCRGRAHA